MNSTFKSVLFWFAIIVAAFGIYQYSSLTPSDAEIPFNEFQARAEKGEIFDAVFNGNKITGTLKPQPGGDLSFDDKAGTKVQAVAVETLTITNGNRAVVKGTATVNGNSGYRFELTVVDNGEPGSSDGFNLVVTKPLNPLYHYESNGTLGGGNIQVQPY